MTRTPAITMLATIGHFLAGHAIAMLMLSVGLRTDRSVFRSIATRWNVLLRAFVIVWIAVPLLAWGLTVILQPSSLGAIGLIAMAICPGVPLVLHKVKKAQGDPELSLLLLITTALSALVMIPIWSAILARFTAVDLSLDPRDIGNVLLPVILLPFVAGRIINEISERVAHVLAKVTMVLFIAGFILLVIAVVSKSLGQLRELGFRDIVAALLVPLGAAVIGYAGAGGGHSNRVSMAYAAALGNPMLAITALAHAGPGHQFKALPIVGAFLLVRALALLPFKLWLDHDHDHHGPSTSEVAHSHS